MLFAVLAGKCFLEFRREYAFLGFGGKMLFSVLVEKYGFTGLAEKCVFMKMCVLCFFCGKTHLAVLAEKCIFQFWRENAFFGYSGKMYMQKNKIYRFGLN